MKYIIDVPEDRVHGDILCALAIMEDSLDHYLPTGIKAVPYDESEAEQRGREEAWKLAQELENMEIEDWKDCFHGSCEDGLTKMSFDEANERYKEWQEQKSGIRVGDEVRSKDEPEDVMVFTGTDEPGYASGIKSNGRAVLRRMNDIEKTGRHFPEVAEVLEKMKEPE